MGTIYLIHFDQPYKHAQHYIGFAEHDLLARLDEHAKTLWERWSEPQDDGQGHMRSGQKHGNGALLLGVLNSLGIGFRVVRTWSGDRNFERQLKNMKHSSRFCPVCSPQNRRIQFVGHPDTYQLPEEISND